MMISACPLTEEKVSAALLPVSPLLSLQETLVPAVPVCLKECRTCLGGLQAFLFCKKLFHRCMKNAYLSFLLHVYCTWEIFNLTVLAVWSDGTKIFWHMPQVTQHPWMEHLHLCDRVSSALAVAKPCSTWKFTLEINKNLTALSKSLRRIQQTLLCSCP